MPHYSVATKALVVTMKSPIGNYTTGEISKKTGISRHTINRIYAKAIQRGFDPTHSPILLKDEWLEDAPRSGRPTKKTSDLVQNVLEKVCTDLHGREKTCADLAGQLGEEGIEISPKTIWRILQEAGLHKNQANEEACFDKGDEAS